MTIKEARLSKGLTQEEVVQLLNKALKRNITPSSWNKKENYKRSISAVELIEFSNIVGINPKDILLKQ